MIPIPFIFMPRFVKALIGGTITWSNQDQRDHSLIFEKQVAPYGYKIGELKPGESLSKIFDTYIPRIDYTCALHPEEKGTLSHGRKQESKFG
jgi:plastocyanin